MGEYKLLGTKKMHCTSYVNMDAVRVIHPLKDGGSTIVFSGNDTLDVMQDVDEIRRAESVTI
jgi:hypothetical protein